MRWATTAATLAFALGSVLAGLTGAAGPRAAPATRPPVEAPATESTAATVIDPLDSGRPAFRTFTDRDGLPQNSIMELAVDPRGFLWASTQDGVVRYNGRTWEVLNVPNRTLSNFVRTIRIAADGSLWCGRQDGGVSHLRTNGEWETFDSSSGLPHNRVNALLEVAVDGADPAMWVGTNRGGVARWLGGQWTVFDESTGLPDNGVGCLIETGVFGGRTLLAGTRRGLARFDGERWTLIAIDPAKPDEIVDTLYETTDAAGTPTLWVGFGDGRVGHSTDGRTWTTFELNVKDSVSAIVETTAQDGAKTLWVGTGGSGLWRYAHGRWVTFDAKTDFPNTTIWSLLATNSPSGTSTLWVGTDGGLVRMELGRWTSFDTRTGLPANSTYGLLETVDPDGTRNVWFGTRGGGITRLRNGEWTVYGREDGLLDMTIFSLGEVATPGGGRELWAGAGESGLSRFVGGRWQHIDPIPGHAARNVRQIQTSTLADGTQVTWVVTGETGAFRFARGGHAVFDKSTGLPTNSMFSVAEVEERDGASTYWFGLQNGGLARHRNGVSTIFDTSNSPLPNNSILSLRQVTLASGARTLWAGTEGGGVAVLTLDTPEPEWTLLDDTTSPTTLPNNTIYQIRTDAWNRIYLFTNHGVARLTEAPNDAASVPGFLVYTFTTADGLPSNEFNGGASMVDSTGRIWGGTPAGATVFDPAKEVADTRNKPLVVEQRLLAGEQKALEPGESLAYNESSLAFEYALLSYFREGDTRYQSQLVGLDQKPSDWTPQFQRTFTTLPDGSYTFKVWARDYAGNVSGPITIPFDVRPAPWKTWWAFALYGLVLVGGGYGITRYRLRALERRNQELEDRIAERTAQLAETVENLRVSEHRALEAKEEAVAAKEDALEANRAKSVFLSNMSHELRTPLNAVLGFAQLMERDVDRSTDDRKNLSTIMRSGEHLLELINDVLSISKIEAGKLTLNAQSFDFYRLLQGIEEMIRVRSVAKGIQLMFDLTPGMPKYVFGDEAKIRQVIINLLGNAVKFTDHGGVALRARWEDGVAYFEVEDTGQGIADDEIDKVFEAFVQTESGRNAKEGTGLGLAITRNFVEMMGGAIRVRSKVGEGTVFSLDVPLPEADADDVPTAPRRVRSLADGQQEFRILVVDDRWENRSLLSKLLASVGFQVREAENGLHAIQVWQEWRPHLIWMDMRMPVMTGLEATERIRALESESSLPRTTIVALTASAFEHEREKVLAGGCDDFVTKPFRETTIFNKLADYLGVLYVYDEEADIVVEDSDDLLLTRARFDKIPQELVGELNEALMLGNAKGAQQVIDRIEPLDARLANELRKMVKGYQFDEILDVIDAI